MLRRNMGTMIVLTALLGLLAWALWIMITVWTGTDATMSGHGWAALILGVVFSCIIGIGLMSLIFFSNRGGYDEPPALRRDDDEN
jgi:hypothetical protein